MTIVNHPFLEFRNLESIHVLCKELGQLVEKQTGPYVVNVDTIDGLRVVTPPHMVPVYGADESYKNYKAIHP